MHRCLKYLKSKAEKVFVMSVKSNNLLIFLAFLQRKPSWPFMAGIPPFTYRGRGESNSGGYAAESDYYCNLRKHQHKGENLPKIKLNLL